MGKQYRSCSFFTKLTTDELWKGTFTEASAGAREGREKRARERERETEREREREGRKALNRS